MFAPITIALQSPLTHGAEEIRELVILREMCAGDLRGVSVGSLTHDDILEVTSRLVGVPTPVLRQLKMPDYMALADVVGGFFDSGR
ncbi:MAG: phage tail assembly protein [Desulfovibrio sp.]|jgi:hypothetical protein|nr:phage tail assembly protein [Desulfovibrio sp.]